ncbi:MAG TPA: class D sortase [Gammaproteobacteria bacterium]
MRLRDGVELGAWALGAALVLSFGAARLGFDAARARGVRVFEEARLDRAPADGRRLPRSPPTVDQSHWSPQRVAAFVAAATSPGVPEAVLRVPSVALEVPVYAGASELNLNRGAAHIEGTAPLGASGNAGIAAHRDGFFRELEALALDAEIVLDLGARTLRYRVAELGIVSPEDTQVLAPTATPSLTLVTCYPFYFVGHAPQRYVVRARLIDGHLSASSPQSARATTVSGSVNHQEE